MLPIKTPWGTYRTIERRDGYTVRILEFLPNAATGYAAHFRRSESMTLLAGSVTVHGTPTEDTPFFTVDTPGTTWEVPKLEVHQITAGPEGAVICELWIGDSDENDSVGVKVEGWTDA